MRFSIRIYDVPELAGQQLIGYDTRYPNYWTMMNLCRAAGLNHIVDFKDEPGHRFTDKVVHGRLLRDRFNGVIPAGRYEIVHLTDDEVEWTEVFR